MHADLGDDWLHLSVRDNGIGGADPAGSGITGLRDRVDAHGGTFTLESDSGAGTLGACLLPTKAPTPPLW